MDDLQPGDPAAIGGYRLLGRLGAGGMGQVFLGMSPGGRKVAVKLIHSVHAGTDHFRERFAREVEAARRVGGFHTAVVVDADPDANPPWMVTAYIEGASLQEKIDRDGPLPLEKVRELGAALAEGLCAIHACGLVHRDLKPANVILAPDGPRIIDFGIARAAGATALTTAGVVIGTYSYMSPEQVSGDAVGPASDVFSLGCVLAYASTGRLPFGADAPAPVMLRVISEPPDLSGLTDGTLRDLISACLAKFPQARPPIQAVLGRLAATGGLAPVVAAPDPAAQRPAAQRPAAQRPAAQRPVTADTGPPRTLPPHAAGRTSASPPTVTGWRAPAGIAAGPVSPRAGESRAGRSRRFAALIVTAAVATALAVALPLALSTSHPGSRAVGHGPSPVRGTRGLRPRTSVIDTVPARALNLRSSDVGYFTDMSFSPDGKLLAAGAESGPGGNDIYLFDLETGSLAAVLDDPGNYEFDSAVAFSPDGAVLAAAVTTKTSTRVFLWDVAARRLIATLDGPGAAPINQGQGIVAFSPNGSLLAAVAAGGVDISIWDVASRHPATTLRAASGVGGLAFSPDGSRLAAVNNGSQTWIWNTATGQQVATLRSKPGASYGQPGFIGGNTAGQGLAYSPDGTILATTSDHASIYLWNTATDSLTGILPSARPLNQPPSSQVWGVAFSPDGTLLAGLGRVTNSVFVWNVATHRSVGMFSTPDDVVVDGIAFSPDSKVLAVSSGTQIFLRPVSQLTG